MKKLIYKFLFPFVNSKYELESKWWHRLIKVIYWIIILLFFIVIYMVIFWLIWDIHWNKTYSWEKLTQKYSINEFAELFAKQQKGIWVVNAMDFDSDDVEKYKYMLKQWIPQERADRLIIEYHNSKQQKGIWVVNAMEFNDKDAEMFNYLLNKWYSQDEAGDAVYKFKIQQQPAQQEEVAKEILEISYQYVISLWISLFILYFVNIFFQLFYYRVILYVIYWNI